MRRVALAGCLAVVVAGALSACSSSGGGAGGGSPSGSAVNGPPGTPLVIGAVGAYTGTFSLQYGGGQPGIDAWAKWTNAHGGINGHPVKLVVKDDGGDASKSVVAVKELVEQDHAIAIVGSATPNDAAWASYVQGKGIPVIGGYISSGNAANPDFFPTGTAQSSSVPNGLAAGAKLAGSTKIGLVYCAEKASCTGAVSLFKKLSPTVGLDLAYTGGISSTAPDYTATCLSAKASGAKLIAVALDTDTIGRLATSCKQQNYTPYITTSTITSNQLKVPALDGKLISIFTVFPYYLNSTPAQKNFHAAVDQYEPGLTNKQIYGEQVAVSWTSGQLFAAAVAGAKVSGIPTPTQLKNGLVGLHNETLGGLAPPLNFTLDGSSNGSKCFYEAGVKDGKVGPTALGAGVICPPVT